MHRQILLQDLQRTGRPPHTFPSLFTVYSFEYSLRGSCIREKQSSGFHRRSKLDLTKLKSTHGIGLGSKSAEEFHRGALPLAILTIGIIIFPSECLVWHRRNAEGCGHDIVDLFHQLLLFCTQCLLNDDFRNRLGFQR